MGIYGYFGWGEAANHMITKNSGLLYPFFFATYMVLYDTCIYCTMYFFCSTEANNGTKYVKTVINNSERFTFLSIQILPISAQSV